MKRLPVVGGGMAGMACVELRHLSPNARRSELRSHDSVDIILRRGRTHAVESTEIATVRVQCSGAHA
jgi:hypothetical protein